MRMAPPEENADPTADPWAEFIRVTAPEFRKPTIEQLETVTKPIWEALVAGARYSHDRIMEIWDDDPARRRGHRQRDRAIPRSSSPASRGCGSCRRTRWRCATPTSRRCFSGLPVGRPDASGRRSGRVPPPARADARRAQRLPGSVGVDPCPPDEFNTNSPWLQPVPVPRGGRLPARGAARPTWHRLESTVRTSEAPFDVQSRPARRRQGRLPVAGLASGAWTWG